MRRRKAIETVKQRLKVSERRACRVLGQHRSTQRHTVKTADDEKTLIKRTVELAEQYGRYGYRMITGFLKEEGFRVNHKRVERIWRQEGLKVPKKQPKRRRLWLHDGSCIRLRAAHKNHVWSYDIVFERTHDGRALRILTIIDEFTRESLAIRVSRRLTSHNVIEQLAELFITKGMPEHIRSDNGPEFTAKAVRSWLTRLGVKTLFIEPGSPWENGYIESFNGKLRNELLNGEIFTTLLEAQVLIEQWRQMYNHIRPHSALGYKPPAPRAIVPSYINSTLTLNVVQ
jgi:transposase InsO family protein